MKNGITILFLFLAVLSFSQENINKYTIVKSILDSISEEYNRESKYNLVFNVSINNNYPIDYQQYRKVLAVDTIVSFKDSTIINNLIKIDDYNVKSIPYYKSIGHFTKDYENTILVNVSDPLDCWLSYNKSIMNEEEFQGVINFPIKLSIYKNLWRDVKELLFIYKVTVKGDKINLEKIKL